MTNSSNQTTDQAVRPDVNRLTEQDTYLIREGNHFRLYNHLGAHVMEVDGVIGTHFGVWAPNAQRVSVIGDFNGWNPDSHALYVRPDGTGIWHGFIPHVGTGTLYKYHIESRTDHYQVNKGDPFAFAWEEPPRTASVVQTLDYEWNDDAWMTERVNRNAHDRPFSVYEVHLGSWRRVIEENNRSLTYREMAKYLVDYVKEMGFTHVEFMPLTEHPFYGSWGYQTTGYFAPTALYGTPQDLMYLIDTMHQHDIGVIMDWVPSHFPADEHGLVYFDGTHLFEHADPRQGFHPDWRSYIFNYGRSEVRNFLISSALFWLDKYHIDGIRVDGVASMLYLDYSRKEGEWIPNQHGGRENLETVNFLRRFNEVVYDQYPGVQTIAEESTSWPMVSRPTYVGGLGFGMKWNMGWMHDVLDYMEKDPIHRKYHHNQLTFSIWYAFQENFMLPLSHDEVVYGKGSLLGKMPGDDWQKFANLRLLLGFMFGHPGKKLLFMGGEFGQWKEWNHDSSLDWHLLESKMHGQMRNWLGDLNHFYRNQPALHELDFSPEGFAWVDMQNVERSTLSFLRKGKTEGDYLLVTCNFTPVPQNNYRVGVPYGGYWEECLNSDAPIYGGSGQGNLGTVEASPVPYYGSFDYSLSLTLPPLSVLYMRYKGQQA